MPKLRKGFHDAAAYNFHHSKLSKRKEMKILKDKSQLCFHLNFLLPVVLSFHIWIYPILLKNFYILWAEMVLFIAEKKKTNQLKATLSPVFAANMCFNLSPLYACTLRKYLSYLFCVFALSWALHKGDSTESQSVWCTLCYSVSSLFILQTKVTSSAKQTRGTSTETWIAYGIDSISPATASKRKGQYLHQK